MYLEEARLSQQEENMVKLLGLEGGQLLYDFKVDETVQSVGVHVYALNGGAWELFSGGGGQAFTGAAGRLALSFENIADGLRVAVQGASGSGAVSFTTEPAQQAAGMSRTTSMRDGRTEIVYEREIPLAIQILTTQNAVHSYDVDYFFKPEAYEGLGYEHVYAVTVRFSQKAVGELEAPDGAAKSKEEPGG